MKNPRRKQNVGALISVALLLSAIAVTVYAATFINQLNTPNGSPTNTNPYQFYVCSDTSFGEGPAIEYSVNGGGFTCNPCSFVANNTTNCSASVFQCTIPRQASATVQYQFFNLSTFGDCGSSRSLFTGFKSFTTDASGNPAAPTVANGVIHGQVLTSEGLAVAGVVLRLDGTQTRTAISDSLGFYNFTEVETNGFYTITPERADYTFNPRSRSFSNLASRIEAAFTATPDLSATANPIDTPEFFVRQQYLDFLSREPDQSGYDYWSAQLKECRGEAVCLSARRIDVSAAFFIEREFQDTGFFIYRLSKASFGNSPSYKRFIADRNKVVGGNDLEASKASFADEWAARKEFRQVYPDSMSNADFVNKLFDTAGLFPDAAERQQQISAMAGGKTRAQVLRDVIETGEFMQKERNRAFVLVEYFAYLQRDPDEAGYNFWLNVLDSLEPNNYRGMVCSFLTSAEYQKRFGAVATHGNRECGQ